jgi:hypothetical protein
MLSQIIRLIPNVIPSTSGIENTLLSASFHHKKINITINNIITDLNSSCKSLSVATLAVSPSFCIVCMLYQVGNFSEILSNLSFIESTASTEFVHFFLATHIYTESCKSHE